MIFFENNLLHFKKINYFYSSERIINSILIFEQEYGNEQHEKTKNKSLTR